MVVIAGIITGIVVYRRNQQAQREQEEKDVADAAAREQQARAAGYGGPPPPYGSDAPTVFLPPVPPVGGPPPGADPYGLLSGRDHPDNPTLYSGDQAGPTEVIGGPATAGGPAHRTTAAHCRFRPGHPGRWRRRSRNPVLDTGFRRHRQRP